MAALGGGKAPAFLVFASDGVSARRDDVAAQKQQVVDAFSGGGWRIPELMAQLPEATDFFMDSISRATLDHYSRPGSSWSATPRTATRSAASAPGSRWSGAAVLAGELLAAGGDHAVAFARYEEKFRDYASISQKVNAGRLLAPETRIGIRFRNLLFGALTLVGLLMKLVDRPATNLELEDYDALRAVVRRPCRLRPHPVRDPPATSPG